MRAADGCLESEGRRGRLSNARARHSDKLDMVFGELEHQLRSGGIFPKVIMYLMEITGKNSPYTINRSEAKREIDLALAWAFWGG